MLSTVKKGFFWNDSRSRRRLSNSDCMSWRKYFIEKGFSIYASAPSFKPLILLSRSFLAVMKTNGICERFKSVFTVLQRSKPFISGIITSEIMMSILLASNFAIASLPLQAVSTVNDGLIWSARNLRILSLSSTISTAQPLASSFIWLESSSSTQSGDSKVCMLLCSIPSLLIGIFTTNVFSFLSSSSSINMPPSSCANDSDKGKPMPTPFSPLFDLSI